MKTQLYLFTLAALLGMAACGTKESGEEKEPEKPTDKTTYTVTYSYEIGSSKNKVTQTIESGTMAVPPRDTSYNEGAQLLGWSTSSLKITPWNFTTDVVSKNVDLYAYYTYPLIFDYSGKAPQDTVWLTDLIPARQSSEVVPTQIPDVGNLIFEGWYLDAAFTSIRNPSSEVVRGKRAFYAKWIPAYTVTFNSTGGNPLASIKVKQNTLLSRPAKITNPDTTQLFWGWYQEAACTNLWDFYTDTVKSDVTLYAKWYSIATSGMDFLILITTCNGKTIQVLKDDLPGTYTWTIDGKEPFAHYNPCPEGWEVPTLSELYCIENALHTLPQRNEYYWSSDYSYYNNGQSCYANVAWVTNDGKIHGRFEENINAKNHVRCKKCK